MKARPLRVGLVVTLAAVLAACSTNVQPGAPQTTEQTPTSATNQSPTGKTLPYAGAPQVTNPLPASVLSGDPCTDALTNDQVRTILGVAIAGKRDDSGALGPSCDWTNTDRGSSVGVTYDTTNHDGLSSIYQNTKPQAVVWKELPSIQGLPAVAGVTPNSGPRDRFCDISIGITDESVVDVSIMLGDSKAGTTDPCTVTEQVAGMVVGNLKQKAGS
jgi:hypothetical protein